MHDNFIYSLPPPIPCRYQSSSSFDALYLHSLPDLVANSSRSPQQPAKYTVLLNQTAIHGLPAALNQVQGEEGERTGRV